jgi:uncharacterized protein (DUF1330 family)
MTTTLYTAFEVNDFEAWKEAFDAEAVNREQSGITTKNMFRSVANHNIIAILYDVPSLQAAKAFFEDPKYHAKMTAAGIISDVQMRVLGSA